MIGEQVLRGNKFNAVSIVAVLLVVSRFVSGFGTAMQELDATRDHARSICLELVC